jgi:hypothetical protein
MYPTAPTAFGLSINFFLSPEGSMKAVPAVTDFARTAGVMSGSGNAVFRSHGLTSLRSMSKEITMNLNLSIGPLVSLIAGILILVMPKLLNYIVAVYLIIIGLLGLFGAGSLHLR